MNLLFQKIRPTSEAVLASINALGITEATLGHGAAELFPLKSDDRVSDAVNAFGFDTRVDFHVCIHTLFSCDYRPDKIMNSRSVTVGEVCELVEKKAVAHRAQILSLFGKEDFALRVYATLLGPNPSYISLNSRVGNLYANTNGIGLVRRAIVHYGIFWQRMMVELREANRAEGIRAIFLGGCSKAKDTFEQMTVRSICKKISAEIGNDVNDRRVESHSK